jgi:hypothetical protein
MLMLSNRHPANPFILPMLILPDVWCSHQYFPSADTVLVGEKHQQGQPVGVKGGSRINYE